jgi:predicted dehydrogenase
MRRFDPAYMSARQKISDGVIGRPVMLRANSRDPFWPEKEEDHRYNSLFLDLGVHGFDEARWLMNSEVVELYAIGGALVYPQLANFGDADNAIVSLKFANGAIGTLDFSRNARYGYDIRTEILGDNGALQIGALQQTQLLDLTPDGVTHDVYSWYPERFTEAFVAELAAFVEAVQAGRRPTPGLPEGRKATELALAATQSLAQDKPVTLPS